MEKLPLELISAIVVPASYADDVPTLLSCTLVSRTWNAIATPFLFRNIQLHVVPREDQLAASQHAYPTHRVRTLAKLQEFLSSNPSLSRHVRIFRIEIVPPSAAPIDDLTSAYAVEPECLRRLLESIPSVRKIALKNIVLSRKLLDDEQYIIPRLNRLELNFLRCSYRYSSPSGDALDILEMFSGATNLIVRSLRGIDPLNIPRGLLAIRDRKFETRRFLLTDVANPEAPFVFVNPNPSALCWLGIHSVSETTLQWLSSALPRFCANLEHFMFSVEADTIVNVVNESLTLPSDPSSLNFLAWGANPVNRLTWSNLRILVFHMPAVVDWFCNEAWQGAHHILRSISFPHFPALRMIHLVLQHLAIDNTHFMNGVIRAMVPQFESVDTKLAELAERASFKGLYLCIQRDIGTYGGIGSLHNTAHNNALHETFPRLHEKSLLYLMDSSEMPSN